MTFLPDWLLGRVQRLPLKVAGVAVVALVVGLIGAVGLLTPANSPAAPPPGGDARSGPETRLTSLEPAGGGDLGADVILKVGGALALLYLGSLALRRFQSGTAGPGQATRLMTPLDRLRLPAQPTVQAVRIADRVLILGVTPHQITVLSELAADELPQMPGPSSRPDFAALLQRLSPASRPPGGTE